MSPGWPTPSRHWLAGCLIAEPPHTAPWCVGRAAFNLIRPAAGPLASGCWSGCPLLRPLLFLCVLVVFGRLARACYSRQCPSAPLSATVRVSFSHLPREAGLGWGTQLTTHNQGGEGLVAHGRGWRSPPAVTWATVKRIGQHQPLSSPPAPPPYGWGPAGSSASRRKKT